MNGTTTRCISLAQGNQDPLERVNYSFGLVLGVDEFVDEQRYFLEKEYQHNRGLHGYGTVSGLEVTRQQNGEDIEVRVAPGIGIDQYGRVFVVRSTQCASLLTWLDEHDLETGEQQIYVVARYDVCETELVPIAGQPCSSSEALNAPSRLRDIFHIELTLAPPPQPAHQALRNLGEFVARFRIEDDAAPLPELQQPTSLAQLIGPSFISLSSDDFQDHLNTAIEEALETPGARLFPIQAAEALALRDAIFAYWVTVVRPTLSPDLINPETPQNNGEEPPPAEVVLAQITLTVPENGAEPALEEILVDNVQRPLLLQSGLIQELFRFPAEGGEAAAAPQRPAYEFGTLEQIGPQTLSLWLHIGSNLELRPADNVHLLLVGGQGDLQPLQFALQEDETRRNSDSRFYTVSTRRAFRDGDFVLMQFDADAIPVAVAGRTQPLSDLMERQPVAYANYNRNDQRLMLFHIGRSPEAIDEEQLRELIREMMPDIPPPSPHLPFVTITPITGGRGEFDLLQSFELWFHLDGRLGTLDGAIRELTNENLLLFNETANGIQQVLFELDQERPNLWYAFPARSNEGFGTFLARFAIPLDAQLVIEAFDPNEEDIREFPTLREYMEETGQRLNGHLMESERFGEVMVFYVREQGRARRVESNE